MQKTDTLIRTKLRLPFTRAELVPRLRLQERIAQGLRGPLTLITAPAGFGKTTLAASFTAGCGLPAAWLSLDKNDNQASRFLNYLVAAVHGANERIGSDAAQLMAGMQPAPAEVVLTSLINDLEASTGEMVLVLDDYQFIHSQAVHEQVEFLLDHCPKTFHLLVATRSDPPFPLARLRARGQMVELRAADLVFTDSEAAQFLNGIMDLGLDSGSVAVLKERTEGWIAGLQMAALSMQGRDDKDGLIRAFAGTNRFIMDYLLEEVLVREPEEVQSFLLQTSILTRLAGPLCDTMTGALGGQDMLEKLERRNLFVISLDDDRRWFRYHHLFADLLQTRLHQSGAEQVAKLYLRAAEWCEQQGQIADAVNYALATNDYCRAGSLIVQHWLDVANNGEIETAWSWLEALPVEEIQFSAPLGIAYCWVLWLRGQVCAIAPRLADVENAMDSLIMAEGASSDDAAYTELAVQLALLKSMVARYGNDFDAAVALAEHALSLLPKDLPPQSDVQMRALISFALASAYDGAGNLEQAANAYAEHIRLSRIVANITGISIIIRMNRLLRLLGRLREADAACRDALAYVQAQGMSRLPAAGILPVAMSEVLVEQNDLEAAETHLAQGLEIGKWGGRLDAVKNAAFARARLRQALNDPKGALAAIQEAESAIGEPQPPLARAELLALRARILVRQNALHEAAQCVAEAERLASRDRGQTSETVALASSRVMAAQSNPGKAVAQLTSSIAGAEERGRLGSAIELYILRSLVYQHQGDTQTAEADLEHALALAQPEGYVRIFLDEGKPMKFLLAQWLSHAYAGPLKDYAIHLLSQLETELHEVQPQPAKACPELVEETAARPVQVLIEPLTERELEILNLIALGMANKEIARQLYISPGTVKAHSANIYRKLDVANRTEAAARARQLGLLP